MPKNNGLKKSVPGAVEESERPVRRTLREADVRRSSFYRGYRQYGRWTEGIGVAFRSPRHFCNPIQDTVKAQCMEGALTIGALSKNPP